MQHNRNEKNDQIGAVAPESNRKANSGVPLSGWVALAWCCTVLAAYYAYNWEYYIVKVSTFAAYLRP